MCFNPAAVPWLLPEVSTAIDWCGVAGWEDCGAVHDLSSTTFIGEPGDCGGWGGGVKCWVQWKVVELQEENRVVMSSSWKVAPHTLHEEDGQLNTS